MPRGLDFWIHVTPRAKRSEVGGLRGDAIRVAVREPALDGRANQACLRALARAFGVRPGAVELAAGARGRRKRIRIGGDEPALRQRLSELAAEPRVG
jgi:hypothetical protein